MNHATLFSSLPLSDVFVLSLTLSLLCILSSGCQVYSSAEILAPLQYLSHIQLTKASAELSQWEVGQT